MSCMMCMGAILYEEFSKVIYAATLEDSNNNYYPEIVVPIKNLSKYSKNKIEIQVYRKMGFIERLLGKAYIEE